jgi:hypothetical protein
MAKTKKQKNRELQRLPSEEAQRAALRLQAEYGSTGLVRSELWLTPRAIIALSGGRCAGSGKPRAKAQKGHPSTHFGHIGVPWVAPSYQ